MIDHSAFVHPKAHVENASIGPRTRIWQFASVIRGAILGADCNVASCATLDGPRFGDRCIVCQGVAMGPGFKIGNDVFIGPNVTICNDRWPTTEKDGWEIAPFQSGRYTVIVGAGTGIGANAVILPGVTIGAQCMIAAGAVVDRDVPERHLFRRDGSLRPIAKDHVPQRMRLLPC